MDIRIPGNPSRSLISVNSQEFINDTFGDSRKNQEDSKEISDQNQNGVMHTLPLSQKRLLEEDWEPGK